MADTVLTVIDLAKLNTFKADAAFASVGADTLIANFAMPEKDEKYLIGIKNNVAVAEYYVEVESTVTGALLVKASGASTGEINYNNVALVKSDGTALYTVSPTGKYVLKVSGTKTATIKAGDHIQSAFGDLTVSLAHTAVNWIAIDSGRFKNITGTNKGKVVIQGQDANIQVKVIKLP